MDPLSTIKLKREEKSVMIAIKDLEVRKIAPIFQLKPETVYIINEYDSMALFPDENTGYFDQSAINVSNVYIVNGESLISSQTLVPISRTTTSYSSIHPLPSTRLPLSFKTKPIRKTIAVVSLSTSNKPSTSKGSVLDYNVVTQVVITLDSKHCSPLNVAELVGQQVDFEVVLLDSKCYPIIESDTTTTIDFWKSNRKILAASKSLYKRLTGSSTSLKRASNEQDPVLSDEELGRRDAKCVCLASDKLDKILCIVESIHKKNEIAETVGAYLECVVCKDIVKKPQYSPCCKRIVACQSCICRWFSSSSLCPHCSTPGLLAQYTDVKGIDQMLDCLRSIRKPSVEGDSTVHIEIDSDPDLPIVNVTQQQ